MCLRQRPSLCLCVCVARASFQHPFMILLTDVSLLQQFITLAVVTSPSSSNIYRGERAAEIHTPLITYKQKIMRGTGNSFSQLSLKPERRAQIIRKAKWNSLCRWRCHIHSALALEVP